MLAFCYACFETGKVFRQSIFWKKRWFTNKTSCVIIKHMMFRLLGQKASGRGENFPVPLAKEKDERKDTNEDQRYFGRRKTDPFV